MVQGGVQYATGFVIGTKAAIIILLSTLHFVSKDIDISSRNDSSIEYDMIHNVCYRILNTDSVELVSVCIKRFWEGI